MTVHDFTFATNDDDEPSFIINFPNGYGIGIEFESKPYSWRGVFVSNRIIVRATYNEEYIDTYPYCEKNNFATEVDNKQLKEILEWVLAQ
jgi:hypothetical protein